MVFDEVEDFGFFFVEEGFWWEFFGGEGVYGGCWDVKVSVFEGKVFFFGEVEMKRR